MESIGEKLKNARIAKGLFIEQISVGTNISKKYIEAIEEERFDDFPGEAYLLGFLRTYADYIELNGDEFVATYKKLKIQEQPIPEDLYVPSEKFKLVHILIILIVLIIGGSGVFLFMNKATLFPVTEIAREELTNKKMKEVIVTGIEYEMTSSFVERRFEAGDAIVVNHKEMPYKLIVEKRKNSLMLVMPLDEIELVKGKEFFSDFDGDNSDEIRITIRDVDNDGAVIKFDRNTEAPSVVLSGINTEEELSDVSASAVIAAGTDVANPVSIRSLQKEDAIILESLEKNSFRVNLSFRGYCLMRYEADGGIRKEQYFRQGDTFRFDVLENIKIWISNAGVVDATISGTAYNFGRPGAVSSVMLKWNNKTSGGYELKSVPLS